METIPRASFDNLPTELVLLILQYAAEPTFTQPEQYVTKNPYSTARTLCLVSRVVRRVALPEMLHTVLLSFRNVRAFVHALRMQAEYAQTDSCLYLAYTRHIRNIWIGHPISVPESDLDLLAPVLLGAPSLAIDFSSMDLVKRCVEHTWTHVDKNIDRQCSPPPWRTKTLTLSGMGIAPWHIIKRPSGSAFLASVAHLITLPHTQIDSNLHIIRRTTGVIGPQDYVLPRWMRHAPWALFKGLESVSLAFPHINRSLNLYDFITGMNLRTELLTFPASLVKGRRVPMEIKASAKTGNWHISLNDVRLVVSDSLVHFSVFHQEWEKVWACGL
ncbi:uncharacterized protein BJ212DRAFT_234467 [Suillus subaureus]|uniref:F-box domain-containing protein n=1 Tax=Suillus subaureus TaxID=48587 RepID=A0A9P7E9X7_9AGAM|nr:uncharacterized protein BJ212DRAFT_234467 [Suillus subaureus]KAG1815673.1 hypothetical protein BJ212DRAFT_234467 [Suillus subaureus]